MIIPVITLYQPWASYVMLGWKTIETRTHKRFKCLVGHTIGIHAGLSYDTQDYVYDYLMPDQREIAARLEFPTGKLLGTVNVNKFLELNGSHSNEALIDCEEVARFGLFLGSPIEINPVKVRGSMGIWYYDTEKQIKVKKEGEIKTSGATLFA